MPKENVKVKVKVEMELTVDSSNLSYYMDGEREFDEVMLETYLRSLIAGGLIDIQVDHVDATKLSERNQK